jgi:hypothetical protein
MADLNTRGREPTPCAAIVEQYSCGCHSRTTVEKRRRDCPKCREISYLVRQPASCIPRLYQIDVPIKCEKCEHPAGEGEVGSDNSTASQPHQDHSTTTQPAQAGTSVIQQQQLLCSASFARFICGCASRVGVKHEQSCPNCRYICQAANQGALCRPRPLQVNVERICDKCLLHIAQHVGEPPRCLTTTRTEDSSNGCTDCRFGEDG